MVITVKKSTSKITLSDIAREANVGVATVDRVLNKRAAVKESTAYRVLEAARRLGFTLEQPHYRLAAGKAQRVGADDAVARGGEDRPPFHPGADEFARLADL